MNIKFLVLFLIFFAITPTLGFFTFPGFFIISFVVIIFLPFLFGKLNLFNYHLSKASLQGIPLLLYALLFYSATYYGGLYQNKSSLLSGYVLFFLAITYSFIYFYFLKRPDHKKFLYAITILYFLISVWTLINSPSPHCDCFVQLNEAPRLVLQGKNPYSSFFSQVYPNIKPDYFGYLPFSFVITLPFVVVFNDPRYSIIFFNVVTVFVLAQLFKEAADKKLINLFILTFLFLPRSFYILEHMYQDSVLFSFFLLFLYFYQKKRTNLSLFFLTLFFSMKQNMLPLLLIFLKKQIVTVENLFLKGFPLFLIPILISLYFLLINPGAFLSDTVLFFNPTTQPAPINSSLSLPTFIKYTTQFSYITLIHVISTSLFLVFYCIGLMKGKVSLVNFIFVFDLLFNYFMYNSFFNHYYFLSLFLLFSIALEALNVKLESNSLN